MAACRLQIAACRMQSAECRVQIAATGLESEIVDCMLVNPHSQAFKIRYINTYISVSKTRSDKVVRLQISSSVFLEISSSDDICLFYITSSSFNPHSVVSGFLFLVSSFIFHLFECRYSQPHQPTS